MAKNDRNDQSIREPKTGPTKPTIVTIGASAGGVTALQRFFEALPGNTGAAFVVVVHLDPNHRSGLPEILGGRTRMPVIQVNKTERLEADHVYVIPPDRRVQLVTTRSLPRNSRNRAENGLRLTGFCALPPNTRAQALRSS